jgi:hypothetical protein
MAPLGPIVSPRGHPIAPALQNYYLLSAIYLKKYSYIPGHPDAVPTTY